MYGVPVLMSGLGTLVLKKKEIQIIQQHHKKILERIQKLHPSTPDPVVFFLSGTLPAPAIIHLRQLTLFGMITRLQGSVLHEHAVRVLTVSKPSSMSWVLQLRELCLQYQLPHPIILLKQPMSKLAFKTLVRNHVQSFWQEKLRHEASCLTSLVYFRPAYQDHTRFGQLPSSILMKVIKLGFKQECYQAGTEQRLSVASGPQTLEDIVCYQPVKVWKLKKTLNMY